jgi:putative transposase
MKLSKSSFYAWKAGPTQLIVEQELQLYRRTKALFNASREMAKKLRAKSVNVTRYKTMKVMAKIKLQAKQRVAYKVTTKRKHSDSFVTKLLNQNFNPVGQDQINDLSSVHYEKLPN